MFLNERQQTILSILKRKKMLKVNELQNHIFCSPSTLRRDLIDLEKAGVLIRGHGRVQYLPEKNIEFSSFYRESENTEAKEVICKLATILLADGMSLFIDSSSTVEQIIPHLSTYKNLVVITNNYKLGTFISESDNITGFLIGGKIKNYSSSIIGSLTHTFIEQFKADFTIFSCRGIDQNGLYEADQEQAMIKKQMMNNSKKNILLIDHSKFGDSHVYRLSDFEKIDYIITDREPDQEMMKIFKESQCDVIF